MTQWLPLLSALIVASVAFAGVLINNRTNRNAITAADERNIVTLKAAQNNMEATNEAAAQRGHEQWRRETVLEVINDILTVSEEVSRSLEYREDWSDPKVVRTETWLILDQIRAKAQLLRILTSSDLVRRCGDLNSALQSSMSTAIELHRLTDDASEQERLKLQEEHSSRIGAILEAEDRLIAAMRTELGIEVGSD